jgi:PAS domain S-box-containing protein
MNLHFNAFSITLLMSGVVALLIALILFQRSQFPAIFWFAVMMLASSIWAVFYSFELSSSSLEEMLFWINLEYLGISFLPATWIMFIFHFIGKKEWLIPRIIIPIFSFPILAVLFVWTNFLHHIHYEAVALVTDGPFPLLDITPGLWYHIHTVYFYFLIAFGMILIGRYYANSELIYRKQTRIILIGAAIPWITNFIYLIGYRPYHHIDLTPYAFILTSLVISFGLLRYQLFTILPFAKEKLIDNIREGMLVVNASGNVIHFNRTMKKFLPTQNKIIGQPVDEVFPNQEALHRLVTRPTNGKEEITLPGRKEERFYEVSASALYDKKRKWIGTLLVFWNITGRKKTTEKLKAQSDELQRLNDLKAKVFSIIAHDLRSPLASLSAILQFSKDDEVSEEELKKLLPFLARDLEYTSALLENLLYWGRSQLAGEVIHLEHFDLKTIIVEKIQFFQLAANQKLVQLINEVSEKIIVYADRTMISMVVHNLLSNAIKYCRAGDSVTTSVIAEGTFVQCKIADTGIGMDEQTVGQLFELGNKSKVGTKLEKGTGLGLKLCKDFIDKNQGKIWAESQLEKGSTFYFKLRSTGLAV